ncbi:MAG: ABC transporter permease [Phycisphaerales bacterium]
MSLLARLNFIQGSRRFKWIASVVVVALMSLTLGVLWVDANRPGSATEGAAASPGQTREVINPGPMARFIDAGPVALLKQGAEACKRSMRSSEGTLIIVGIAAALATGTLFVIWLGLGLSYLALLVLGWGVAWPLAAWEPTARMGQVLLGVVPLTLFFLILMQVLKVALSGSTPVFAVARNVLTEAVRMKVSLVFIVILILFLAVIPGMLTEDQPLRFRVQQWLSYGVGLSYAVLAMLTLFLAAGTVAFEQRDRIIWQTMTKPVRHWEYVLGKWLGVMGLNAVLLTVTAAGVFLFAEYLSHQKAVGEVSYLVREDGKRADPTDPQVDREIEARMADVKQRFENFQDTPRTREIVRYQVVNEFMSEDRRILELQVLTARAGVQPLPPDLNMEAVSKALDSRVEQAIADNPALEPSPRLRKELESELLKSIYIEARSIEPGFTSIFVFEGLKAVKERAERGELTLRYKVNAGSNNPSDIYRLRFIINGFPRDVSTALKVTNSLSIEPDVIDDEGRLTIEIGSDPSNEFTVNFPPGGLELMYRSGGYEANFFRVMSALWVKLGFIAAVAIAAATFLNFPVACLVALTVLFAAESSGFLKESLEVYVSYDEKTKEVNYFAVLVRAVAIPASWAFQAFSELKPAEKLVEGRLVSWASLGGAVALIGSWTLGALTIGWIAFRRRELAVYSGQ